MGDFIYGFLIGRVIGGIFVLACKIVWFFLRIAWWLGVSDLLGRPRPPGAPSPAIGRPGVKRLIAVGGRGMRMTRGAAAAVVLAAVLLAGVAVAGCGASGTLPQQAATGSSAPGAAAQGGVPTAGGAPASAVAPSCLGNTAIVPGNCTPEQAADGYFQSQLAGNWTQTCAYVVPSGQGACQQAASSADIGPLTGNLAVGAEMIQGAEAIVGAAGSLCSSSCDYSTPANIDFPSGYGSAFTTAYAQTISTMTSPGSNFSPLPCLEVGGLWYVNIPGPLGGFPWS